MKRLFGFAVGGFACAAAGAFAAVVLAGGVSAAALLTTGTTATTTTGDYDDDSSARAVPPGVTISGIAVGGLSPEEATTLVQEGVKHAASVLVLSPGSNSPLSFRFRARRISVNRVS